MPFFKRISEYSGSSLRRFMLLPLLRSYSVLNLNDYLEHSKIVAYYYQCHSKSVYCSASILQTTPTVVPIQGANPTGDSSDCYCSATNFQASNAVHFVSIHTLPKVMSSQTHPASDYLIPTRLHRSLAPSFSELEMQNLSCIDSRSFSQPWASPERNSYHPVSYTHLTLPTIYSV